MADLGLGLIEKLATLSSVFYGRPGCLSRSVVMVVDFVGERGQVRWTRRVLRGKIGARHLVVLLVVARKHGLPVRADCMRESEACVLTPTFGRCDFPLPLSQCPDGRSVAVGRGCTLIAELLD